MKPIETVADTRSIPLADAHSGHGPILVTASAFLLLLAVVFVDVKFGARFGVLLFYLIPIAWTAWFAPKNLSWAVGVFCALARLGVEIVGDRDVGAWRPELAWNLASELGFFLIFTGLISKIQSQLSLERSLARCDGLTQLLNARAFEGSVSIERERLRRYGHVLSLLYFDLDNFKAVNETWGHGKGDEVLQMVARIVSHHTRQIDSAARLGGDQFAVLLPDTDARGARIVLERLQRKIVGAMEGHEWPVTVSLGCVTFHADMPSSAAMLRAADAAMLRAKNSGKNQIYQTAFNGETESN